MRAFAILLLSALSAVSSTAQPSGNVIVDKNGVMRWEKTKEEVRGFGINYTAMFAHAYRTAQKRNVPLERAIDDDIYHFSRLGFDLFRVHIWDTEISDTLGNLLTNEHLKLFDYAISRMKARGFRFMLTPIAFWGNGWPEPDDKTPGFAAKYGKDACLTHPDAIRAQQNYLRQFLSHVNAYTGLAYKDDPAVLAFEVSNEPHHREAPEKVTAFIRGMVDAMRSTGCKKPVFYNVSHSIHLSEAYAKAGIQGGTFQWYPTGLGSGHELGGNLLPNVDRYDIPFAATPSYKKMAKVAYEFDAADVGRSYIYPAMARSFRTAGIQVAAHFAYDPTYMADVNTEYGTHYMNLAYAPQKALSLKIAGEVFRRVPMNKSFGAYPANTTFDAFRISYELDLAEMVTEKEFYYTNHTATLPPAPASLEHIAGWGDSPLVKYEGTGAYFLDKLEPGVWRLEVMPDAVWIDDPFKPASPKKKVAVIQWNEWPMTLALPDLSQSYEMRPVGETAPPTKPSHVRPGIYLLIRQGVQFNPGEVARGKVTEFSAPQSSVSRLHVLHQPLREVAEGEAIAIQATVIAPTTPAAVEVHVEGRRWGGETIPMTRVRNFLYTASISAPKSPGFLRYYIIVHTGNAKRTYPPDVDGDPREWDFVDRRPYEIAVLPSAAPITLFDAQRDFARLSRTWIPGSGLVPAAGGAELNVPIQQLFTEDAENPNGPRIADYSLRCFFGDRVQGLKSAMAGRKSLVLKARSIDGPCPIQVALINGNGQAFGAIVRLEPGKSEYTIAIADLRPVRLVTLPRPYPTFLPYYFQGGVSGSFDITEAETLQLSVGPGMSEEESRKGLSLTIQSLRLQ